MTTASSNTSQPKLGFLVQGDVEKLLVETLARKIAAQLPIPLEPRMGTIRFGGPFRVLTVVPEIHFMAEKGYAPVIMVFDEKVDEDPSRTNLFQVERLLMKYEFQSYARLIPVTPSIEAWVLADEDAVRQVAGTPTPPLASRDGKTPKEVLKQWLGGWDTVRQEAVARLLEPVRIRMREPSFLKFEQAVQEVLRARLGSQLDTSLREPGTHP
jgi:hypothetical protein